MKKIAWIFKTSNQKLVFLGLFAFILNFILFSLKFYFSYQSNSLALRTESFNNLSDALNNALIFLAILYAHKPADVEHPYGHQRFEYISSLLLSLGLLYLAFSTFVTSIQKIYTSDFQPPQFTSTLYFLLLFSIFTKLLLFFLYLAFARKYTSLSLRVSAYDSLLDVISSFLVLLSLQTYQWLGYSLDAWLSILLTFFLFYTAYNILKETVSSLLGRGLAAEEVADIKEKILRFPSVLGCHDLLWHNYGKGQIYLSCHIELSSSLSLVKAHEIADIIEKYFYEKENISLLIHVDPYTPLTEEGEKYLKALNSFLETQWPQAILHEFRWKKNEQNTVQVKNEKGELPTFKKAQVRFELMFPFDAPQEDSHIKRELFTWSKEHFPDVELKLILERGLG